MKWIFCALVLAVAAPAWGQSIYKCRDAKGQPVYQSAPCPEAEKRWDTQASTTTWDDYYKRQAADRKVEADRRHMRAKAQEISSVGGGSGASMGGRDSDRCEATRRQRDAAYERMGTRRTFDASRYWDNLVWEACK